MINPDPILRKLFEDIDRTKVRVWALTNAYRTVSVELFGPITSLLNLSTQHAFRVLRILGVDDLIEGVIYCDYADPMFSCKPEPQFYLNVSPMVLVVATT
jgi:pyrimidine and pyridine-specific 5'-nucleotidase